MPAKLLHSLFWCLALATMGAASPEPTPSPLPSATSELPAYATQDPRVAELYRWASAHRAELRYIPCTCGCEAEGHRNNWNCYVKDEPSPGEYVWDAHAADCGICQGITQQVRTGLEAGKPLTRIRREVDKKWGATRMKTPTPPPEPVD